METDKDHFQLPNWLFTKPYERKRTYLEEENVKTANESKELWKVLKPLRMKSNKVNQSKIALKKGGVIQFEPMKHAHSFKKFYSE